MSKGREGAADLNPYAAPTAVVDDLHANPEAAAIRMQHLSHEASIRSVGALYYLAAILGLFAVLSTLPGAAAGGRGTGYVLGYGVAGTALCAAFGALGYGLRGLRRWARIPAVLLAVLGLLGFPIGTLINAYILWLLLSAKGRTVLSAPYALVVQATPDIRYRGSRVVLIVFVVLIALIVLAVALPALLR